MFSAFGIENARNYRNKLLYEACHCKFTADNNNNVNADYSRHNFCTKTANSEYIFQIWNIGFCLYFQLARIFN
jgi:hypothetical protein